MSFNAEAALVKVTAYNVQSGKAHSVVSARPLPASVILSLELLVCWLVTGEALCSRWFLSRSILVCLKGPRGPRQAAEDVRNRFELHAARDQAPDELRQGR